LKNGTSIFLTTMVLMALALDRTFFCASAANADSYHSHVRQVVEQLPSHFDSWMGDDIPVPTGALNMLHPNVLISRKFRHVMTGEEFTFLLVQVHDARDLLGHFPPVCYPGQGWVLGSANSIDWNGEGMKLGGMEYLFNRDRLDGAASIVVDNFFLLPNGSCCRNMDQVENEAEDRRQKLFGAAEVQFLFDVRIPEDRRRQIIEHFLAFQSPVFDAILRGKKS
jgi:Protein of unknown function (DUF3485)